MYKEAKTSNFDYWNNKPVTKITQTVTQTKQIFDDTTIKNVYGTNKETSLPPNFVWDIVEIGNSDKDKSVYIKSLTDIIGAKDAALYLYLNKVSTTY